MKKGQKLWTRDEILIAINLYHKLSFGQLHSKNKDIIEIAKYLGRTSNSLSLKLANIASLDSSLNRKGMSNYSKLDHETWNEFYDKPEDVVFESEELINKILIQFDEIHKKTLKTESIISIKQRVNQTFFRKSVLASYNNKCCISGVNIKSMLIASHIIPWSINEANRLNPSNGLCLNTLYDNAFDKGFITIDEDYRIILSKMLKDNYNLFIKDNFHKIEGKPIVLPNKLLPDKSFLIYHNENVFIQ
jgi:predicted restriction endonuclease